MKLHVVAIKRFQTLPFPAMIFASEASCHDLPIAKQMIENQSFQGFCFVGDKAYSDAAWKASLLDKDILLLTPAKGGRGLPAPLPGGNAMDTAISAAHQPIESFFHWLHEKTGIQFAFKVHSLKGLLLPIFGGLAAALLFLRSFP